MKTAMTVLALGGIALVITMIVWPWGAFDWKRSFFPGSLDWSDPYSHPGNHNPPWLYVALHPLARLGPRWGYTALIFLTLLSLVCVTGGPANLLPLALTSPLLVCIVEGQVDGLIAWALIGPAPLALTIAAAKPQGLWLAALARSSKASFVILAAVMGVSVLVWPGWMARFYAPHSAPWCLWPASLLPAILLAIYGLVGRRWSQASLCAASLLALPYYSPSSLVPVMATAMCGGGKVWKATMVLASWAWWFWVFKGGKL